MVLGFRVDKMLSSQSGKLVSEFWMLRIFDVSRVS